MGWEELGTRAKSLLEEVSVAEGHLDAVYIGELQAGLAVARLHPRVALDAVLARHAAGGGGPVAPVSGRRLVVAMELAKKLRRYVSHRQGTQVRGSAYHAKKV